MGKFINGLLIGLGIGVLVAPMKGEETRRLVSERITSLRTSLPSGEQTPQYQRLASDPVSQAASMLKDTATLTRLTGSMLADTTPHTASKVKQTSQDMAKTTKQTARSTMRDTSGRTTQG